MKTIAVSLMLISFHAFAAPSFQESVAGLKELKAQGEKTIARAKECLPAISEDRIDLCGGGSIPSTKAFVSLDKDACLREIRAKGYVINDEVEKSAVLPDEIKEFARSTKRAQTFHDHKTVILRKGVGNRIDCLHELVHVYQWTSGSTETLAPRERLKHSAAIEKNLESALLEVEKLERAKKKKDAKKLAAELNPYIAHLKEWNELTDWLDEKDAHFVVFSLCSKLDCPLADLDVATANLYKRKKYLPASFHPELDRVALDVLVKLKEGSKKTQN